jgi:hypothetical protein
MKNLKSHPHVYKASNVMFDSQRVFATSYDWWVFVRVIGGKVVFNAHRYSTSTQRHQSKVRDLMASLGIGIDIFVDTRESLGTTMPDRTVGRFTTFQALCEYQRAMTRLNRNARARAKRAESKRPYSCCFQASI